MMKGAQKESSKEIDLRPTIPPGHDAMYSTRYINLDVLGTFWKKI